ncbi:MAG TPA: glycosyltransferase family 2 protein [Luteitalea sp.]|nr:glycosyltransferase family 2 protein [Luteitalea sp.]
MTQPPLLSIVVPTRNRAIYAVPSITRLLRIDSTRLEVVVADNSEDDDTAIGLGASLQEPRLRYERIAGRNTLSENFEHGCRMARGEFIACIGDDDGVHPVLLEVAAWAEHHDLDAVAGPVLADYGWPDFVRRYYGADSAAVLRVRPFSGALSFPDVDREFAKVLEAGGQDFAGIPRIYYGLIRRRCFEAVRQAHGACFPGVSPDMAGAVALASAVQRLAWIDFPLFLPGSSRKSGSGQSARKQHVGRMEDQKHMGGERLANWPDRVPRFYAVQTVWAASLFTALEATGRQHLAAGFNDAKLHAMCAVFNPSYAGETLRHLRGLRAAGIGRSSLQAFAAYYAHIWAMRVRSLTGRAWAAAAASSRDRFHKGLSDIGAAVDCLERELAAETTALRRRLNAGPEQ